MIQLRFAARTFGHARLDDELLDALFVQQDGLEKVVGIGIFGYGLAVLFGDLEELCLGRAFFA
jgi:hypothetical protein